MTGNIPGNPVQPLHSFVIDGKPFHQRVPGIIVYTKMNTKGIREFRRFCEHHSMAIVVWLGNEREVVVCERGMQWDEFESVCGIGAWEVLGSESNLERLTGNVSVERWHEPIACNVHCRGAGAGPEKVKAKKVFRDPEPGEWTEAHIAYREAVRDGRMEDADKILEKLAKNQK